ncbi:E4 [Gammapapillomavirus sp.]|uniref:E4 n=1 Tax=Gammapapillomavirus sp. TaxID=2049444 RepID=UPI000C472E10|nr:E4 [Gammapapillomavirus sp.]ATQ38619.1 E4 [Gammapapillomavirus sp.]
MMSKIHFPIPTGTIFTIRMQMINGIKLQAKLIIMVYILRNQMGTELILSYLKKMQPLMDVQDNGLLDIKKPLFLLLLLVHPGPPSSRKQGAPPSTPKPSRKPTVRIEDLKVTPPNPPNFLLRRQLFPLDEDDEDPEKENHPLENGEEPSNQQVQPPSELHRMLTKWEELIDQLIDIISHDLHDFKQRLGIHR